MGEGAGPAVLSEGAEAGLPDDRPGSWLTVLRVHALRGSWHSDWHSASRGGSLQPCPPPCHSHLQGRASCPGLEPPVPKAHPASPEQTGASKARTTSQVTLGAYFDPVVLPNMWALQVAALLAMAGRDHVPCELEKKCPRDKHPGPTQPVTQGPRPAQWRAPCGVCLHGLNARAPVITPRPEGPGSTHSSTLAAALPEIPASSCLPSTSPSALFWASLALLPLLLTFICSLGSP